MDIRSGAGYPASALSNFAPHPFEFDGIVVNSFEGLLQSFKFKNIEMQKHVCTLVGKAAKYKGKNKNWQTSQTLYWNGVEYKRESPEYRLLLTRAYDALSKNDAFAKALVSTGSARLQHSMGRTNPKETVLTQAEFCGFLTWIRHKLNNPS